MYRPLNSLQSRFGINQDQIRTWMKYLIITGVLLFSMFLAYLGDESLLLFGIVGVVGLGTALVFLKQPMLGLAALIVVTMLAPPPFRGGGMQSLNPAILMIVFLLGLWLFDMFARQRAIKFVPTRTNLPMLGLMIVSILAFFNGQLRYFIFAQNAPIDAQIGQLAIFILSGMAFILAINQIVDLVWLKRLTWFYLILSGVYIAARMVPSIGVPISSLFQVGSTSSVFWIWVVSLAASQALYNRELAVRWRAALFLLVAATFYVAIVLAYTWKSGWLPSLVSLMVILLIGSPRLRIPAIMIGLFGAFIYFADLEGFVTGSEDYSLMTRVAAWQIILQIIKVNPVLGLGPANYYWYTHLFPILGYNVAFNSHNNYLDIIAQIGFLGLGCFLWFAWEYGRIGWRLFPKLPDGFSRAYVIGALGGLAGTLVTMMLGDWVFPFVYNVGLIAFRATVVSWVFFGGMIVIERLFHGQEAQSVKE